MLVELHSVWFSEIISQKYLTQRKAVINITPLLSAEVEKFSFHFQRKFVDKNGQN
jgi:hypothetical protein